MAPETTTPSTSPRRASMGCLAGILLAIALAVVFVWVGMRSAEEARRHQEEALADYARKEVEQIKSGKHVAALWTADQIRMLAADPDCVRNVSTLNCSMNELTGPGVSELKKLVNVRRMTFYCLETDHILAAIKGMPSIEELSFSSTGPSDESIRSFAAFPNLKKLRFDVIDQEREQLIRQTLPAVEIEIDDRELDKPAAQTSESASVEFIGVAPGFGVKQIKAAGVPLLVDDAAGFYLIGSATGTDDRNNIASFVKTTDGALHSMNGDTKVSLPYTFTVEPDATDKTKLAFKISLGPATMPLATVSMPVDGHRQLFTSYRFEGAKKIERYDENPDHYTPPNRGQYNIRFAPGQPKWGEMIGPDFTVRVTLTSSSRPMSLAFVDAPSLSTGVRNVEFGFGALKVGDQATATGYIQITKTPPEDSRPQ